MSLFESRLRVRSTATTLGYFLNLHKDGELFLDAEYQRPYVWGEEHQQALLKSIFENQPIDSVAVALNPKDPERYCEMVDGKQRITTLIMFCEDKIPYKPENGQPLFFSEMEMPDQRNFKKTRLTSNELLSNDSKPDTQVDKVKYFLQKNFGGAPQTEEHRLKVEEMYLVLQSKN